MRQGDAAHRPVFEPLAINQDAFGRAAILVSDETDQIAIIFIHPAGARREGRFAGIAALFKGQLPGCAGVKIMLDEAGEQEPAGLCRAAIDVAVALPGKPLVDRSEFQDAIIQPLFTRRAVGEVESDRKSVV